MRSLKLLIVAFAVPTFFGAAAYAAPITSFQPTLLPHTDSAFDLGTSTRAWRDAFIDRICLTSDTCRTSWPAGGSGGATGLASSSSPVPWTPGFITYVRDDASLSSVATGTVSGVGVSVTANRYVIGGNLVITNDGVTSLSGTAPIVASAATGAVNLTCNAASGAQAGCLSSTDWTTFSSKQATIGITWPITLSGATIGFNGLSTSTAAVVGNIPYFSGANTFANVATTTATCSGNTTCTAFTVLGSSPITISSTGGGGGSGNVATSSTETSTYVPFWTSTGATPATLSGGDSGFAWNNTDKRLTFSYGSSTAYTAGTLFASTANATSTFAGDISLTSGSGRLVTHSIRSDQSDGVLIEAANYTDVGIFGAGNSANATFYGGVNIDGTTRLATSLSGLAQLTSGTVSAVTGTTGQFPYYSGTNAVTATSTLFVDTASEVGVGTTNPLTSLDVAAGTDTTNTIKDVLYLRHNTTATPTTNWGVGFGMYGDSATVDNREMLRLTSKWRVATDATRSTYVEAYGYNNGAITKMFQWGRASATFETLGNDSVTTVLGAGSSQNIINSNSTSGNVSKLTLFSENTLRAAWLGSQNNSLFFGTGNSVATVLTLASTTNTGIGTSNPQSKLDVSGGVAIGSYAGVDSAPSNGLIVSGNVGIGSTTPWGLLSVNANGLVAGTPQFVVGSSTATNFVVANSGRVGVATTSPSSSFAFGVTGNGYFSNGITLGTVLTVPNGGTGVATLTGVAIGNGTSAFTAASAQTCTNQFVRVMSASYVATCATVGAADVSLATLTATDSTLTFSGTYNGSTARTVGLNLAQANTWTALQQFNGQASTTMLSGYRAFFGGTATSTFTTAGWLGIGTSSPWSALTLGVASSSITVPEYKRNATSTSMTVAATDGNQQLLQIGTSATTITLNVQTFLPGQTLRLTVCNPGSTAGAITWATSNPAGALLWTGGTAPTQTTTANKCDLYSFIGTQATSTSAGTTAKIFGAASTNF